MCVCIYIYVYLHMYGNRSSSFLEKDTYRKPHKDRTVCSVGEMSNARFVGDVCRTANERKETDTGGLRGTLHTIVSFTEDIIIF